MNFLLARDQVMLFETAANLRASRRLRLEKQNSLFPLGAVIKSDLFSTPMALKSCLSQICNDGVQFQMKIRKISRRHPRSVDDAELGHFKAEKCTKNYNARAQLLFCSLNLLFSNVPVACRRGFFKTLMLAIEGDNKCFTNEKAPWFFFNP